MTRTTILTALTLALLAPFAVLAGGKGGFNTHEDPMIRGDSKSTDLGWEVEPLLTVGEIDGKKDDFNLRWTGYRVPGILDGLGAIALADGTVRVLANHEFGATVGYAYELANKTKLTGARVSYIDVNPTTRKVVAAGPAYDRVYDRAGKVVTTAQQINEGSSSTDGFDRFCSAYLVEAGDRGFVDDVFLTGEETGGGQECALDIANGNLYVAPMMGRAAFENVCPVENFGSNKVAILIGDDRGGAPLLLYVGEKGAKPASGYSPPSFLVANGLGYGRLFVWTTPSDTTPSTFNGTGSSRKGKFVPIKHFDPAMAGMAGYDSLGFVTQATQDTLAAAAGAFRFSRPEDLASNPEDGTEVVFASTGRSSLFPADSWGTTYIVDLDDTSLKAALQGNLASITSISAEISILYDGDDAGNGQFSGPDFGLRSPDNLDWASDGYIYVNEDRSVSGFGAKSGVEASVWQIDPSTGKLARILEMDRSAVPAGQTDPVPTDIGNWESSGVLDVTSLFKAKKGETILLLDVQAHSVRDGLIGGNANLVQGGQLLLASFRENKK
jgi:hypothetical protein